MRDPTPEPGRGLSAPLLCPRTPFSTAQVFPCPCYKCCGLDYETEELRMGFGDVSDYRLADCLAKAVMRMPFLGLPKKLINLQFFLEQDLKKNDVAQN